ncbi:P-loop containing nucleoside triphosphate hydrolase protein [Cylindrobasidium torrendii FP15055 ss-10]|uniref:DNA 3'-5' helicase n=1 Tax=Cylindrobasidium torrendii FP15055 ss-10 TaxID=1314674 RepID=A0A0D7B7Y1_9AGAR|nr:P-loop containing nucleoside triphosphate hydrolase protein [Cylindrobasidium torrendii FP15055 ss-10]
MFFSRVASLAILSSAVLAADFAHLQSRQDASSDVVSEVKDIFNTLDSVTNEALPEIDAMWQAQNLTTQLATPYLQKIADALGEARDALKALPEAGSASSAASSASSTSTGSATSTVASDSASATPSAASLVSRQDDGKQELADLMSDILVRSGQVLGPIVLELDGKVAEVPSLLSALDDMLNEIVTLVDGQIPGAADLVSADVKPVFHGIVLLGLPKLLETLDLTEAAQQQHVHTAMADDCSIGTKRWEPMETGNWRDGLLLSHAVFDYATSASGSNMRLSGSDEIFCSTKEKNALRDPNTPPLLLGKQPECCLLRIPKGVRYNFHFEELFRRDAGGSDSSYECHRPWSIGKIRTRPYLPVQTTHQPIYDAFDELDEEFLSMGSSPCPPGRNVQHYSQFTPQQPTEYTHYDPNPIGEYYDDSGYVEVYDEEPLAQYEPQPQQQVDYYDDYQGKPIFQDFLSTNFTIEDAYMEPPPLHARAQPMQQGQRVPQGPVMSHPYNNPIQEEPAPQREVLTQLKGIRLRPVSELPDMYRGLFKFGVFNAVQSSCYDTVASAPTGSGKTVLFELAIIEMLSRTDSVGQNTMKCIYMAPTKALCSERYRDWTTKFGPLGVKCTISYVTTAEKWDSLTRNWDDHSTILSSILLFLVDEVHILNESRGSTLEVVVSRMRMRGSSVRFVMVSATAPNVQDIAAWIGSIDKSQDSAKVFEFGEDFRPCKLKKVVIGVQRNKNQNDFMFAKNLDYKLFPTLQTHSVGKPILIFCATRKGVFSTGERLMKEYQEAEKKRQALPWARPSRLEHNFDDKRLTELSSYGVGVHHAGMSLGDRRAVEELFIERKIRVIVATSTLAVGVNLPAHTVVIKGVYTFQNNASMEYSDLDVMQMLGRAGRPQFDNEGTAIIMCEDELEPKYRALASGTTVLESSLHLSLSEHLNSEIGLGTVTSISTATEWLRGSFLFQRVRKNPQYYALGKEEDQTWEGRVDDMVAQSIEKLVESELITVTGETLRSTEYGDIMSKFYIKQATMAAILALPEKAGLRDILETISSAEEMNNSKMRASDKTYLNKLKKHNDIRFGVKKVETSADKVFLLLQAVLGGIPLSGPEYKTGDSQPQSEAFMVFKHVLRVARAVVEVAICKQKGAQLKHSLEAHGKIALSYSVKLIPSEKNRKATVLAENGINTITDLRKLDAYRIEQLLNRRPPFGMDMLHTLRSEVPVYTLRVKETDTRTSAGEGPVEVDLSIECALASTVSKKSKGKTSWTNILTLTSDMDLIDFRRTSTKSLEEKKTFEITAMLEKPSQNVEVHISSETWAGVTVVKVYKPDIPSSEYPTKNTRPATSLQLELDDMENDPEFWSKMAAEDDVEVDSIESKSPNAKSRKAATKRVNEPDSDMVQGDRETGNKSKPLIGATGRRKDDDGPIVEKAKVSNIQSESERLPNGMYRSVPLRSYVNILLIACTLSCAHLCKDKLKCRHICCREGLAKPSKSATAQLKRTATETDKPSVSSKKIKAKSPLTPSAPKASVTKKQTDNTMEQLEALHKQNNVEDNLRLSSGQRLKLNSGPFTASKRLKKEVRPPIKFAFAEENKDRDVYDTALSDLNEDDDELPDAHEITKFDLSGVSQAHNRAPAAGPRRSDSDDFFDGDSEIDELIAGLPSDPSLHCRSSALPETRPRVSLSPSPRPKKRAKYPATPPKVSTYLSGLSGCVSHSFLKQKSPLFLPGSDVETYATDDDEVLYIPPPPEDDDWNMSQPAQVMESGSIAEQYEEDDDFVLDPSIDVVPATVQEEERLKSTYIDPGVPVMQSRKDDRVIGHSANREYRKESFNEGGAEPKREGQSEFEEMDDLAQLEDWLQNSGAIEIVP